MMANEPLNVLLLATPKPDTKPSATVLHVLEWECDIREFQSLGKPHPYHRDGLPMFERPIFQGGENMPIGAATNGGEAMTWHDELTETEQADWVESLDTFACSKSWVEAISYRDFNRKCHDGFVTTEDTARESYHRLQALLAKWRGEG